MNTLEEKLKKEIADLDKKFSDSNKLDGFKETSDKFEKLVRSGIAKKRGNNLVSPLDAHLKSHTWFNSKQH